MVIFHNLSCKRSFTRPGTYQNSLENPLGSILMSGAHVPAGAKVKHPEAHGAPVATNGLSFRHPPWSEGMGWAAGLSKNHGFHQRKWCFNQQKWWLKQQDWKSKQQKWCVLPRELGVQPANMVWIGGLNPQNMEVETPQNHGANGIQLGKWGEWGGVNPHHQP